MKKLILIALLASGITQLEAQKMEFWLDAGAKVQYGATMLYNSAIGDDPNYDYTITTSTKFGGKLGLNWNYTGISFDVMVGKHKGQFQNLTTAGLPNDEISMQSVDLYLLFRNAKNKGYFELGPKMGLIGDVRSGDAIIDPAQYESTSFAGVLGFGTYILGNDGAFSGILGLRFEYGFTDVVSDLGQTEGARQPVNYTGEVANTVPIFAGIVFEFNWGIGGVGQARCGEKSKFIWF